MNTNAIKRFRETFISHPYGILKDDNIFHPEYKPLTIENIESFLELELNTARQEAYSDVEKGLPKEKDGWGEFGKKDINEWEDGNNACRTAVLAHLASLRNKL